MLKKVITYKNFNDEEVTEEFYFHLSIADIAEMQLSVAGGLDKMLRKMIVNAEANPGVVINTMKNIILKTIGKRSEDGSRFEKSDEITKDFLNSPAYSVLFMELVTNANAAAEFIYGVAPKELSEQAKEMGLLEDVQLPVKAAIRTDENDGQPAWIREDREPTKKELISMSKEQLLQLMERRMQKS